MSSNNEIHNKLSDVFAKALTQFQAEGGKVKDIHWFKSEAAKDKLSKEVKKSNKTKTS